MAADLVTAIASAALVRFAGAGLDHYGKVALERAQQVGGKALAMLAAVGREPQLVEPKILIPLVQAASLETDETLAEKWAALLANAADPTQGVAVQPGFIEVLRQLTPADAEVMRFIYNGQPSLSSSLAKPIAVFAGELVGFGIPFKTVALSIENLLRLRLCERPALPMINPGADTAIATGYSVLPTIFGDAFLAAVTPPTP